MIIKAECIDAAQGRQILRNLGLKPMEGANHAAYEYWVAESGHPYWIPYCHKGDKLRFLKRAFDDVVDELS